IGSYDLSREDRNRLYDAGILLGWYNPIQLERLHLILQRDHSKLFIIDNKSLFIGGTGIADIFSPTNNSQAWRENMFKIKGSIVIDALASLYEKWLSSHASLDRAPAWLDAKPDLFSALF